jgi:hypothetical protein
VGPAEVLEQSRVLEGDLVGLAALVDEVAQVALIAVLAYLFYAEWDGFRGRRPSATLKDRAPNR